MRSISLAAPALMTCVMLAAGCGSDTGGDNKAGAADSAGGPAELVPITKKAIAAVLLEHLPSDPIEQSGSPTSVHLTYATDDMHSAYEEAAEVSISADTESLCAPSPSPYNGYDGCVVEEVGDGELTIYWQGLQIEEDPGLLHLVMVRADDSVTLTYSGLNIADDPRQQEFERFTFDDMVDAVTDPRLGLLTTQDAVDAGAEIEWP